ncbi:MAG: M14 family metallopeptidase [Myxococcaceae bacterium]|nr:M14 family metallopeptidase [Myxococcaceae bacterium]
MTAPALPLLSLLLAASPSLTTVAERSGDVETGRYDEVVSLCAAFPRAYPGKVRCEQFGTTPEGRPMLALVASADGTVTPEAVRRKGRPVMLFQGGIHAGEIDGKDAGFRLLHDALDGKVAKGALSKVTAVFVPVFNVDGHERFGPNNRPNQVGPASMGWRTNAQNLNLNRDYVKAEAPEMQAMLRLLNAYDPVVYLDLHVTDGAKFQPDVAVMIEPLKMGPASLQALGKAYQGELFRDLEARGHAPLEFYPSFLKDDEPASGFAYGIAPPRFSQGYWSLRNRIGVLVETHSWKPYRERVKSTYDILESTLVQAARDGATWRTAMRQADADERAGKDATAVLVWRNTATVTKLKYPGYAYRFEESPALGRKVIRYDESTPQVWEVPYYPDVEPAVSSTLPKGGWVVPAAHARWVAEKLALHGFTSEVLKQGVPASRVERFRAREVKPAAATFEGRQALQFAGEWTEAVEDVAARSLYVPAAQPGRVLLAQLLEPASPDSFLAWGFFNAHFEQKEYLEDYVLDAFAQALLAKDPEVKRAFDTRMKDPEFAKNPRARSQFFMQYHPARDLRQNVYPVVRVASRPKATPAS